MRAEMLRVRATIPYFVGYHRLYAAWLRRLEDSPSERKGQALFNALYAMNPQLADAIHGTPADPFYYDERVQLCFDVVTGGLHGLSCLNIDRIRMLLIQWAAYKRACSPMFENMEVLRKPFDLVAQLQGETLGRCYYLALQLAGEGY